MNAAEGAQEHAFVFLWSPRNKYQIENPYDTALAEFDRLSREGWSLISTGPINGGLVYLFARALPVVTSGSGVSVRVAERNP